MGTVFMYCTVQTDRQNTCIHFALVDVSFQSRHRYLASAVRRLSRGPVLWTEGPIWMMFELSALEELFLDREMHHMSASVSQVMCWSPRLRIVT